MIGNYNAALNFAALLTFFTVPISTVLFPAFAKLQAQKEHELIKTVFASSVKYTSILLVPATMLVMSLSKPIVNTLFGATYAYAPLFLTLYVITNLYAVAGSITLSSFLKGLGETGMLVKQAVLTLLIGVIIAFLLIPNFGIEGAVIGTIISTLLCGIPSFVWGLHWIWKRYEAKPEFKSSLKILAASTLAAIPSFLLTLVLHTHAVIQLVIGGATFLLIYILAAPLINALNHSEIDELRYMFSGLGVVSRIVNVPPHTRRKGRKNQIGQEETSRNLLGCPNPSRTGRGRPKHTDTNEKLVNHAKRFAQTL